MKVRLFDPEKDYEEVASWWSKQEWPVLPLQMLSPMGFIAEKDGQKLAATWMYSTNSPTYIMEWTVGNPDANYEDRNDGLKHVTEEACHWAKTDGAMQVFTMTKHKRFIDKLSSYGFQKTEDEMTHLVRRL